jgi:hypothetical protein
MKVHCRSPIKDLKQLKNKITKFNTGVHIIRDKYKKKTVQQR